MMLPLTILLVSALYASAASASIRPDRLGRKLHDPGKRSVPALSEPVIPNSDPVNPNDIDITATGQSAGGVDVQNPSTQSASQTKLVNALSTSSSVSTGTVMTATAEGLIPTQTMSPDVPQNSDKTLGSTCGQTNPQALIQCLYDKSGKDCTNNGGGCGVLARYLPISPSDKMSCYPDVQVAAEVCAQCNATKAGYSMYNQYLDTCAELFPVKKVVKPQAGSEGAPAAAGESTMTRTSTVTAELGAESSAPPTETGLATSVTVTASGTAVPPSSSTASTSTSQTATTSSSSSTSGLIAAEGLITVFATQAQPTAAPTSAGLNLSSPIPASVSISVGADGVPITEFDSLTASLTTSTSIAEVSDTPASITKQQIARALNATELFFAQVIDAGCGQKDDGCPTWQAAISIASGGTVCAASNFKGAADCSSCVGAAGKSDQATYKIQMEAYGWYRNNCTLATGGKNNEVEGTTLNGVEEVDPIRPVTPLNAASETGVPVALAANAGTSTRQPTVKYVEAAEAQPAPLPTVYRNGGGRRADLSLMSAMIIGAGALATSLL